MKNIKVSLSNSTPVLEQPVEYVERKGIGHPDSLIDGIVERASTDLSNAYADKTGMILHHNLDKGLIVGGSAKAVFGGGEIIKPIEVIVAGRASNRYQDVEIPVNDIVINSAKNYLKENTRFLDLDREVTFSTKILEGSEDLKHIFGRSSEMPLANDTSFGIGFAPFSVTERLVLGTERMLNSKEYKGIVPAVGEDIKVMGIREDKRITLTLAVAFVSKFIGNADEYFTLKDRVKKDVESFVGKTEKGYDVEVVINNGDNRESGSVYITKSGLSCESGDDGSVGRGNRVNGLITPFRNMSLEAAAGKNPMNHIGKIYNVLANLIANDVIKLYPEIEECYVSLVSQIGRPIDDPRHLDIKLGAKDKKIVEKLGNQISGLAEEELANISYLTKEIVAGKHSMF
ncbi:MAG: methionine adenosyltransferase [Candidatus Marsarchaeota archaeon]|nr:methionine adenosyltransferase [Candidatus Marsarchaeota archaeon]